MTNNELRKAINEKIENAKLELSNYKKGEVSFVYLKGQIMAYYDVLTLLEGLEK